MNSEETNPAEGAPHDSFVTTRWTQVLASRGDSTAARQALSDLCAAYYAPVVAFLRREGRSDDAARELAHEFFAGVLERQSLSGATPQRGRFRSYLLGALKHFLANHRQHASREKRGGHVVHEPLVGGSDTSPGLETTIPDPAAPLPEAAFDREWALNILERAFETMKRECVAGDGLREFEMLKPWLTGGNDGRSQADAARELGMSEGAVRVAIHRLRRQFRKLVRTEIAQTVDGPADVDEEMRHLIEALS